MKGKKVVVLLTLLMLASVAFNLPSLYTPPKTTSTNKPQAEFAPPSSQVGEGYPMNLTDSVNDNRTVNLKANDTWAATTYRNATSSGEQLIGFTKVWQNLTITQLKATYDARAIQGGSSSTEYLRARNQTGVNQRLAMRFTTLDKVNLTGVWVYYSLGGLSNIPFTINVTTTDSKTPSGSSSVGGGTIPATGGVDGWYYVQLSSPVTLVRGNYYWLIANASALNTAFFDWYYIRDQGGEDGIYGSTYRMAVGWLDETQMISLGLVPAYFNLMLVLKVIAVDNSLNIRQYSSPQQVNMYLNSTGNPITANSSRISNVFSTFVLCTNTSVTFTARWDARFEKIQTGIATTHFTAENGLTFWNVTFGSGGMPTNTHTLYNRTLRVSTIPDYWTIQPSNVSNTGIVSSFAASFTPLSGYVFIVQGGNPDADPWVDTWLVKAKSTYKITASLAPQVVAGLPLTLGISTGVYSGSWCNVTFYNAVDYPYYSRNITIPLNSLAIKIILNQSGVYTLFLFDRWTGGNEASLNRTLTVSVLKPLCNVSSIDVSSTILGNPATATFRFLNGTAGWTAMQPISVKINGTSVSPSYDVPTGVTTVSWSTASGGWISGLNKVNITAASGVFFNSTVDEFMIIAPDARLLLNATSYSATYADNIPIGFSFLNLTGGVPHSFPSAPTLYRNGSVVSFVSIGGDWYAHILDTHNLPQAGTYSLNFTARYGTHVATNITMVAVSKIPLTLVLNLGQASVTAGSDLGVSANLTYSSGAPIADGTEILFTFNVTYANSTIKSFTTTALTLNGIASSSFTTTSEMKEISVRAFYAGDGTKLSVDDEKLSIPVTPPTAGFPVIVVAGVAVAAVLVAIIPIAVRARRRKGREEEHRKTAVLRQTASLAQLVVVDLRSGRCAFSRSLGSEESVDPNLISGFLSANQSILEEVFKNKSKAGLRFADYGDYKVISHVGNHIMATLFATESAGEELKSVLDKFTDKFEQKYGRALQSWDGDVNTFKDAEEITDEVFALQLTAPYMVLEVPSAKLSKNERAAMHFARILSAERGVFFMPRVVDYLLTKQGLKRGQAMDAINSLTKKGILRQLTIEQAAQVVQSTLEKSGSQG